MSDTVWDVVDTMSDAEKEVAARGWDAAHDWLLQFIDMPPSPDVDPLRHRGFEDGYKCAMALIDQHANPFRGEPEYPEDA